MKLKQLLIVCLLTISGIASAQTYLTQDFSSSTIVSDYVNASAPSNGQWNAISNSGGGTTWSINSGKLRVVRTANAGAMSRTTDFSPTPSHLLVKFDLSVTGNAAAVTNLAAFQIGAGFTTSNATEANSAVHSRIGLNWTTTSGQFSLRDIGASANTANYTGTQTISWYINNSGASISYVAPDGTTETLADDKFDLWVGTSRQFNDAAATTGTNALTDFKFAMSNGSGTIDMDNFMVTPIPQAAITVSPTSLSGFTTTVGTPSAEQSYTVSGSNLGPASGNISVAAVSGFEYSLTSGGTFTSTLTIPYTGGALSTTTVYVRLSGANPGSFSGNAANSGGGATTQNVALSGTVNSLTPFLSATPTSLSGFTNITGTASTSQTYNLSGTNLSPTAGSISITAPTNFEVSNNGSTWGSTTTAAYTAGGTFTTPTVYVRVAASAPAGSVSGNVNNNGGGAPAINVAVSGTVSPVPVLTATPASLSGFSTITGTASTAQTFNLSSTTLLPATGTITVTAPTNFEVSLNGTTYASSVNASYTSGGTFSNPTVYVRIAASAPVGSPSGNITTSGGTVASPPTVAVSGTVVLGPAITVNPTSLSGFLTNQGTPSAAQSYTLTGTNLSPASGNLNVAALSGYEYATVIGGPYTSTLTLAYTGGAFSGTIYVRLTGGNGGSFSGNIANSGGGATSQNVAVSGTVVTPPAVVINKFYNQGTLAASDEVELLVINNNTDLRGMKLKDYSSNGTSDGGGVYQFTTNTLWSSLPAGTLIEITGSTTAPDIDPSDFTLIIGRGNTTYFTLNTGAFDIAANEIVMLKAAGSADAGNAGAIASFATGSATSQTNYTGAPGYKLSSSTGISSLQYAIANNATSTLNDFNGTGASITSAQTFLQPNNSTNSTYICTLRGSTEPTAIASGVNFTSILSTSLTINWTNPGVGGGARRIVVARLTSTTAVAPTDGQTYSANTVFGSGSTTGTNNFVVFDGTGSSVSVTGLTAATSYTFDIYEYNGNSFCTNYFATSVTATQITDNAPAVSAPVALNNVCAVGSNATGSTTATTSGIYNSGNNFNLELSDASGNFPGTIIGALTNNTTSGNISIPYTLNSNTFAPSTLYKIRVTATNPNTTGITSGNFSINNPVDATAQLATANPTQVALSWSNATCLSDVVIVQSTSAITGTPSGTPTLNNPLTGLSSGTVVYIGSTSPQTFTGLINGTTYNYRIFTRIVIGGISYYSSGSTTLTATPIGIDVVINKVYNDGTLATNDEVELLVIKNNADLRGFILKDFSNNGASDVGGIYTFTNIAAWNNIPSGTLIRISGASTAPDIDPSDYTMTVGRANTSYFTATGGTFDISQNEIIMLKIPGSATAGNTGAIHSMAVGSANSQTNFTGSTGYKLSTTNTLTSLSYAYATNTTSSLIDFNGNGAAIGSSLTMLQANNNTNSIYICNLRGGNPEPTTTATGINFTAVGASTITVNWTNPVSNGGARRIVVARLQGTTAVAPADGQTYSANTVFGSGGTTGTNNFVIFDGTGSSVTVSGLTSGTAYSFDVYEYNGLGFCANFYSTPLSGNRTTAATTTVQFVSASASVSEGAGTYNITLSITNPSATVATTGQINFLSTDPGTTGQAADINNFNIGTFTFPAGSSANQTVTITIVDDILFEGNENFVFALQNVTGGTNAQEGTPNTFTLTIVDNEVVGTTIYSTGSGTAATDAIWSFNPTGIGQTISALPGGFQSGRNVVIQSGHNVIFASGPIDVNDLTIQSGGRAYRNSNSPSSYVYFSVYGNIVIDGTLGNTTNSLDGIGLNIEGTACTISGSGTANIARIRKASTTNTTTNLTISRNMNLWHDGTSIHNEAANSSIFNVTISAGTTVNILAANGSVAIDGTNGLGAGNNYGSITTNGNLNIAGTLYLSNNNTGLGACNFIFGNSSIIRVAKVNSQLSSGNGTTVTFASGARMNITNSLNLISGTLTNNSNITIVSDATNTAYIDDFSSGNTGSISGYVRVQRYVSVGASGFRYIGTPVNTNSGVMSLSNLSGFTVSGNPGQVIPLPTCDPNNVAIGSPYGNFMYWNESGPFTVPGCKQSGWYFQTTGNMIVTKGYGAKLSPGNTLTYTGNANTGSISGGTLANTTSEGNGWHLVSNPYPSAIAISNIDANPNNNMPVGFDGQIQFFQSSGAYTGTYQAYNVGSQTAPIALGQGFWIRTASSGSWSLNNNYRTTNNPTYYDENSPVLSHLLVDVSGNGFKDKTEINFIAEAENGFDFYDANKWEGRGEQPMLYTKVGNELAAINSLPAIESTVLVPMGFKPGQNGNYTFDFQDIATFPLSAMIYLEDRKENTVTNLRQNSSYSFISTVNDNADRFIIRFEPPVAIAAADQTCNDKGSLTITQNGSTQWDSYSVTDNNNITYAAGNTFTGTVTVNNLSPQEYIVTLNHNSGYTAQEFITVNGVDQLVTTLDASAATAQVDQAVTFTATTIGNATSYTWNFGDGNLLVSSNNNESHTYDLAGNYIVTVTASNDNCENAAQKTITVNNTTTSINQLDANGVKVFGMGNHIVIEFDNKISEEANITLYNMLGQSLATFNGITTFKGRAELNINNLKPGYYIVQIAINGQLISRKLVLGNN